MNPYEERQQAKKERLLKAAANRRAKDDVAQAAAHRHIELVPFGQPILVGHHSEKRHRAEIARFNANMDKAVNLHKEASELERRAAHIGDAGISSDDPEAVAKLETKLLQKQESHALMVERNKEARAMGQPRPFMAYQLSNSNNNIRSIKERIQQLQRTVTRAKAEPVEGDGWTMNEDTEENRIILKFTEKPNEERRALLRSYAFLWSPSRGAWVRKITPNARYAARHLLAKLAA
jgi:hypothetical protein